jgi:uncharacterized membrane protein YedE/YeeE
MKYLLFGTAFGFVLMKAEVISWFRIQEMFRFQDFHMYGIIGSAILVGIISIQIIKRLGVKDIYGTPIKLSDKDPSQVKRYIIGGLLFGFGWALTGACPGPLFALLGSGISVILVPIFFALVGTWVYGYLQPKLPH